MWLTTKYGDELQISVHKVPVEDFLNIKKKLGHPIIDLDTCWSISFYIGALEVSVYCDKEKCKYCGTNPVCDINCDYCEDCFELVEEAEAEERARQKREDRYDESRGH